jgi:4-amino-4-deoxy-L-arabinose transferase-like glycosyltransferase
MDIETGGEVPAPPNRPASIDSRPLRLILVLFTLAVGLQGFFVLPPGDRDESRFAQATKQMTETGDYLRIMNGTAARNKKPIGIHWLQAPFVLAAGTGLRNPIWPYRVPSLLGAIAAVLAVFETGLLMTGIPAVGALAGAMLAGSVIVATETHIAKTDAALLGATTIAMAILARGWLGARIKRRHAAAFWLASAAGILMKGPITPMVVGLTALTLCVWGRRAAWLRRLRPGWGVPLLLAGVLPWFIAIGIATHGAFFAQAVGGDLGSKLAGGAETHGGFPGLHLLLVPLLAFPSSLAVLWSLPGAWADRNGRATRFLIAWILPAWLVFEAVPTKLPHYTLPLYPALFLLAARFVVLREPPPARWMRFAGRALLLAAGAVIGGGAAALPIVLHGGWWIGLPALALCTIMTWLAWRGRSFSALALAPLLTLAILRIELPNLSALWIAPRVETALRSLWPQWTPSGAGLVVAGYAEPSLMFLAGTKLQNVPDGAEAASALASGAATFAIVSDGALPGFTRQAARLGVAPHALTAIDGFNYSRGRWVTLTLLAP